MASAGDVPWKYDVVIDGQGYMFADVEEVKAIYGYTQTFVPRTNTQGDYGDNQQDFWLKAMQNDWSLGQDLRYYRQDEVNRRRFWDGTAIDVSDVGKAKMRAKGITVTLSAAALAVIEHPNSDNDFIVLSATNAYSVTQAGVVSDLGAHGLGDAPMEHAIAASETDLYFSSSDSGGNGVRKMTSGGAFSTFSTQDCRALAFLNNTLYGADVNKLYRFDSAGVATTLHTWLSADGGADGQVEKIVQYGSKLLIWRLQKTTSGGLSELWIYDGTGVYKVADIPNNLTVTDITLVQGVVYISGVHVLPLGQYRASVYIYLNGSLNLLWSARPKTVSYGSHVCEWEHGLIIQHNDDALFYDPATGGVHTLFSSNNANTMRVTSTKTSVIQWYYDNGTEATIYPDASAVTQASLTTSLFDFDSSLTKIFRGITVEWDAATDGNGGTVDIEYLLNDLENGSFVALQTGAVSGTEYTLSNITGKAIAVRIKLNKGTSTLGPVLRRIAVRAVPKQTTFRKETFVIQCTGRDGVSPLELRDESMEPKDGLTLANALRTSAIATNPMTITDEFGTFTGVIELERFELRRIRPNEFLAVVPVREV